MQENKKFLKLQKVGTIALMCLFVVAFVGSIFCAMILPFANVFSQVAYAADSVVVDSLQSQASSDWSLSNINSYGKFYGVFFNRTWKPSYAECVANKSLFFYEGAENEFRVRINSLRTDIVDGYWTRFFTFYPFVLSVDYAKELGIVIHSDVYAIQSEISLDMSEETIIGGILLIAENDDDMSALLNSDVASTLHFTDSFSYSMFDFANVGTTQTGSTYGDWVLSDSTNINDSFVDFFGDFLFLSFPSFVTTVEVLSPEYFATRFVTPTGSPSNTVFFNLDIMPKSPKLEEFKTFSSGSTSWYYYDYFQEYGTEDSLIMANDVSTVGWHVDVHKQVLPPNTTILGYNVSLRIGKTDIYSYYVSGSNFDTGAISEQKWLVSSNYTFGDLKLYKYDFSGATSYYSLLPHEEGKVLPVDSQFGEAGWNSWLALFDLSNYVSLSSDSYINIGYQNAKLYFDELIRTKTQQSFLQGKNIGYELGFTEGKAQGGNYTFTSLLGAVFDAPIEAFRGLFNFEILGTNMQGFVLALLTLSVIIVVIKYALGGK